MSTRDTAVCGQFYPANPDDIQAMLEHYNEILDKHVKKGEEGVLSLKPRAVIVPHAGYVYSGFTANLALRLLANTDAKRVVVIGPSHRVYLNGTSISEFDTYHTPLGAMYIDQSLVADLKERFDLPFMPEAHHEHSTEVQLPFVKTYTPEVSVVELVYGDESPQKLAEVIEYLLADPETAVVISTDLSHYYDIRKANELDSICLDAVKKLSTAELHQGCEACGKIGVEAMLIAAKKNGLRSILLDYRTSADASGDETQVVGYMSAAFVEQ
ncbi:MAG TPA: AmmeMemoRadiSam system protein B [Sulfurovum sp.]|uniref:AmmeMemoRadiSam system protein B n=1 Tax=Sulfurovum sp. TaxID=1969726 RepID=UPI002F94C263